MPRARTGTLKPTRDGRWQIVVTFMGERVSLPALPKGTSKARAKDQAAYWAGEAERRESAGLGLDGKPAPSRVVMPTGTPVAADEWIGAWLKARAARGTGTTDQGSHYANHIRPVLGDLAVAEWTAADMRRLVAELDRKVRDGEIEWKTAKNIWGTASKMCRDACRSKVEALRCRDNNPAADVEGPDRGPRKRKVYLYPSEALAVLDCAEVPLRWRRWIALAIYTGLRKGEQVALRWADVDLEHRVIHVHRAWCNRTKTIKATKGAHNRRVAIEPALLPLMDAMHAEANGAALVATAMPSACLLAAELRNRYLPKAGVTRAELFEQSATHKRLGWHDLRTTNATWCAVRGDEPLRIQQRLGHTDFNTTRGYIVEADTMCDGFGKPFPALPASLLDSNRSRNRSQHTQVRELIASPTGFEPVLLA